MSDSIGRHQITKDLRQLASLGVRLLESPDEGVIVQNAAESSFLAEVKEKQYTDPILLQLKENVQQGMTKAFELTEEGVLQCQNRLCVPNIDGLRRRIMTEAHHSRYSVHPGSTKMYLELKEVYWWGNMKKSIEEFVVQCPNCQQVKVDHQKHEGYMQRIELPIWKWDMINMDFVTGLPRSFRKFDSIWVIVDRFTKAAHFLPVKTTYTVEEYAKLYIKEIVRLHGVPISIISERGAQFTANFWKSFQKSLGTQVNLNTAFHPQMDGQAERETALFGPDLVHQAMEKVKVIQQRLATAQSRHKSYANNRRRGLEFFIGDWVFLKVSPMKGVMRFGKKGKLSPRYIGPYKIIRRVGQVAYELELPQELSTVHPVFHVSMLRKCIGDPSRITPTEDVHVTEDLTYEEVPITILDRQFKKLRNKEVASVKVLWRNQQVEEVTWEAEEAMKSKYPHLFQSEEKGQSAELRQ
ncbi:uncharacterized protein LOC125816323 [Solanum verrucosum]|uniref:uncharacterized protein LOC125816323 n=1 Tax=Solanum verrucosum TaxID=315347 RepID=UPI0020D05A74|nr:uncharacterized protein LOC125816323 [Solanum verrucosum]